MAAPYATDLRRALDADEIVPYFQPQVELRTGLLTGFEALARWRHLAHGAIAPDVFIPLAEDIGLISTLTRNLLHKVFVSAAAISTSEDISISFNISAVQFHDRSLPDQIHSAAEDTGFSLSRLVLEITESALIDNIDQALSIAQQLKTFGVRLALDDFGTGYSSLRHLQSLPFDELKVDASFIREMSDTRESRKIVAAVIGLGHSLGLTTVAEGIETKAQADMLLWLGCDLGQGWLYGPPVPACDLPSFLSSRPLAFPASPESSRDDRLPSLEALPAQRHAQLQAIYDGAPVGLCFIDRNLRYISINQRLAEINGAPVADHLGRLAQEMIPELFPTLEPYLRRALLGEPFNDLEFSIPRPHADGHFLTFLVSYQPVRDEANEVIGISTAVIDITKRKLAEEALRESEDHYRHSVQLNPQVPWTSDPRGRILEAGPHWENATGWRPDQALGHGWVKALHPDDVMPTLRIWKNCRRTGVPVDIEFRIGRGDGVWRWMRSRAAPRRDSTGAIIRWYGTVEDIDDRKKAEQALRESEALLRAIFDAVPVGILITDSPGGSILMSNPRAEAIFRRPMPVGENLDVYRLSNLFHADGSCFSPDEYPTVRAIRTGQTTDPEEILYRRGDNTHAWIRTTVAPVRGKNGAIVGAVLAIQDIDEAIQEKQKLLELVSTLERQLKTKP
jgi:PAS domain S-box-containing protein